MPGFPAVVFLGTGAAALAASSGLATAADPPKAGRPTPSRPRGAEAHHGRQRALRREHAQRARLLRGGARGAKAKLRSPVSCRARISRVAPEPRVRPGAGRALRGARGGNIVFHQSPRVARYGVQFLGTPLILVLGHSSCGAVDAAIKVVKTKAVLPGHCRDLVTAIKPARDHRGEDRRPTTCSTTRSPRTCAAPGGEAQGCRADRRQGLQRQEDRDRRRRVRHRERQVTLV